MDHQIETIFLLMAAVTALVLLSRRLQLPYPIVLVLGGLILGFVPGLPQVDMKSELVFLVFLPPLLFIEGLMTSWRDFRQNLKPILLLAIGLVVITAAGVALVAHTLIPNLSWAAAFVLGAVVAPTDAVATEAIAERLKLPRRILVVLQGESLVNDATAIVVYNIALRAAMGDGFSLGNAFGQFAMVSAGGIAVGLAIGWLIGRLRRALPQDPPIENTVSLLTPITAYLPADWLHVSGVLSVVACGIYLGRIGPRIVSSQTRMQAIAMWTMIGFLLNGLLFLLVGLQLHQLVKELPAARPFGTLTLIALVISLAVIVVRFLWVFISTYVPRLLSPSLQKRAPAPNWKPVSIVAWSGMRGGVSLAVAIAVPKTLGDGASTVHFPAHNALLYITFVVILVTLVGQGLTLPVLIRKLGVTGGKEEHAEEYRARVHASQVVLDRLRKRSEDSEIAGIDMENLRRFYEYRHQRLIAHGASGETEGDAPEDASQTTIAYLELKKELLTAERMAVVSLRDDGVIGDDTLHRIQADLDLDQARLDSFVSQASYKD